eukprot:4812126-Amphidinium_carterae.1
MCTIRTTEENLPLPREPLLFMFCESFTRDDTLRPPTEQSVSKAGALVSVSSSRVLIQDFASQMQLQAPASGRAHVIFSKYKCKTKAHTTRAHAGEESCNTPMPETNDHPCHPNKEYYRT